MPTPSASPSPLRPKHLNKKHQSVIADNSPTPSPLRSSIKANLKMNDDAAERAARRRSAHFGDLGVGKENIHADGGQSRKASAMSAKDGPQHQRRAKRLSAVAPAIPVSMEVMNTNFEEWMKLATDNKITSANTWNFALIDYFHDLTLLRNGPDDQSINFQKASCTLDGCVKIWTSRVDSVATETGKLLSGLAGGGGGDGEDGDADDDDESGEPKATRKTHRSEATLAKTFAALQVKKFDLEFTVDPLFKKTSADFDEGGAMGLLMNHLGIDGTGRVVFDAGDAVVDEDDEEEEEALEEEIIDITALREFIPTPEITEDLKISDTLAAFHFSADPADMPDLAAIAGLTSNDYADDPVREGSVPLGTGEAVDFFGDDDFNGGGGGFDDDGSVAGDVGGFGDDVFGPGPSVPGGALGMARPGEGHGPFDPRHGAGQELVMALVDTDDNAGMFDYFDAGFAKAWAGAEHWKLRKVARKDPVAAAATKEKKEKKEPFKIDFLGESSQTTKALFAPGTKSATQLPGSSRRGSKKSAAAARREEWLLPDDMHFSSRQLLRLFLKPKFALRMRRSTAQYAQNLNGDIDENFWAQAASDQAGGGGFDTMDMDEAPLPFESQFFHDDGDGDDDAFIDDALDPVDDLAPGEEHDDLWRATQGQELRRPRPENVHYAKKAKRVDVKRLKDDIWNDLKVLVDTNARPQGAVPELDPESESAPASDAEAEAPQTPKEPVQTFDKVIQTLRGSYPREKMSEISTSFCFICLLHLANEEGLRIETARTDGLDGVDSGFKGFAELEDDDTVRPPQQKRMDEGERVDRVVGELQALKVYKDPNAGRAA
ncbi:Condensin complex subunit 2 [Vanrija pseudolonga]|uniref:Condensin complex subunit 2 n=1 Tax=Vanrija pseudolonga TaxID=143232 RepID=A0AAF0Y3R1_9TREE|nr:Condensin complex subunit 2 [Vanrija pseudolonga]